jgi:hypothetical protein
MWGPRRRPLLGAAVIAGVSTAAARREVAANNQKQFMAQQSEELRRSEYERVQAEARNKEERAAWEKERAEAKANEEKLAWERDAERREQERLKAEGGTVGAKANHFGEDTRYCSKCGNSYIVGANFCGHCGTKLTKS